MREEGSRERKARGPERQSGELEGLWKGKSGENAGI